MSELRVINLYLSTEMINRNKEDTWEKSPKFKTFTTDHDTENYWDAPLLADGKFYVVCKSYKDNYAIKLMDYFVIN